MGKYSLITEKNVDVGDFYFSSFPYNRQLDFVPLAVVKKVNEDEDNRYFEVKEEGGQLVLRVDYSKLGATDAILIKRNSGRACFSRSLADKMKAATETEDFKAMKETMAVGAASEGFPTRLS